MPLPEVILWQQIRDNKLGLKFRRQYSVEDYILDFYDSAIKLDIEIDGDTHFRDESANKSDRIRDKFLSKEGIRILRFTNNDVVKNLDAVIDRIKIEATPS